MINHKEIPNLRPEASPNDKMDYKWLASDLLRINRRCVDMLTLDL